MKRSLPSATKLRRLCFYTCLSVILFTGGVCLSACWNTTQPGSRYPPRSRHPSPGAGTSPPWAGTPPEQSTPSGSRHPPGADNPTPPSRHPPSKGYPTNRDTATAADGTHPTGMHSSSKLNLREIGKKNYWWERSLKLRSHVPSTSPFLQATPSTYLTLCVHRTTGLHLTILWTV